MSGPKIVRVVTRAEQIDRCVAQLARLDAAIGEWERIGDRNEILDETLTAEVKKRRAQLDALLRADKFAEVRTEADHLDAWLSTELNARLEAKASAQQRARRACANLRATAASLLKVFESDHTALPPGLRATLEAGVRAASRDENSTEADQALNGAVAHAFRLLAEISTAQRPTQPQRELAERVGEGEVRQSLDEWLAGQIEAMETGDRRLTLAEKQLALLQNVAGLDTPREYETRLSTARREVDSFQRGLRLDALCLDLVAAIRVAKERQDLRFGAAATRAEALARNEAERTSPLLAALDRLIEVGDLSNAKRTLDEVRDILERQAAVRAASARREAVLRGLKELGYEVREGMVTAWARDGRLAIKNPALPGFGVEFSGNVSGDRYQARAVTFHGTSAGPIPSREVELKWCSDLSRLQQFMIAHGGEIVIERSTPAGTHPLRAVADDLREEDDASSVRRFTLD